MDILVTNYGLNFIEFGFSGSLSVNRIYRNKGGFVKPYPTHAKIYKIIKKKFAHIASLDFAQYDMFHVEYTFFFKDNARRDVTNYIKVFEDIVFRLFIKIDDSRVYSTKVTKNIDKRLSMHYVRIEWHPFASQKHSFSFPDEVIKKKNKKSKKQKNG